ncbi:PPE domain-containing protein [Saccharopolyspora gloriosae]|uniref:PPE domain-containing protein n=1 Tax=Saccharopolyspora gloriosae TaxID=455344 RepID=UPI001FB76FA0|nr:PPE domain-containing protein [Saccharopolyspora gloriosae]
MEDLNPIRNLRFQGFDIPELLSWIGKIKDGRGTESMDQAATALQQCAQIVTDLDDTLRVELGKLQIEWTGNAGAIAQEATAKQSAVMQQSQDPLATSATSVEAQGRGFESAKNTLPNRNEMHNSESENFLEKGAGVFGYTSDYDEEAKKIDGRKQVAQQALGSYRDTTVTQAESFQPMPEMQPAAVTAQAAAPSGGAGSGIGTFASPDGGGGSAGVGGADNAIGAISGRSGGRTGGRTGGGGDAPIGGGRSGNKDEHERATGGDPDTNPHDDPKQGGMGLGGILGIGAGGAAVAGLGAVAASKMLGGKAGTPEGSVRGGSAGADKGKAGSLRGGSSGVGGGPGDTTAGRTASGSATSKPAPGSAMGPAATRGQGGSGEDAEHENKYYEEETPFDDNRLVAPPVFGADHEPGDDDEPKKG